MVIEGCLREYKKLMDSNYKFILGKRNKSYTINLSFEKENFYHFVGLHKLKDVEFSPIKDQVFDHIKSSKIIHDQIIMSDHYSESRDRIENISLVHSTLVSSNKHFRYNRSSSNKSKIKWDYLLYDNTEKGRVYIFIQEYKKKKGHYFPVTYLVNPKNNYEISHERMTLLLMELITQGEIIEFYRNKNFVE